MRRWYEQLGAYKDLTGLRVGGRGTEGILESVKFKLIVAGAGALLLVGLGVGASAYATGASVPFLVAAKPSPSPGADRGAACTDFLNHLASNLGVSQSKLRSALQKSADQTIDDAVKAGKITAAEGAKLKQRLASRTACRFAPGPSIRRPGLGPMKVIVAAAAKTLNLTPEQLMQDLRSGQSLSSLAHGMTEDQFRAVFLANLKSQLDQLVQQKKLTADQESKMLQRLQTAPIPFWNSAPRFGPRPGAPVPGASPAASPATGA
jgi:hypothetical protein